MIPDLSLFQGTAKYYSAYRNGYAEALYEEITRKAKLGKDSTVLDVGTGTGTIAMDLAPRVKIVYALDPSREMLDEAKRIAKEKSIEDVVFIEDVAENIDQHSELKDVDLVTFGASLHWVRDIDGMFVKVAGVLKPGGWLSIQFSGNAHVLTENPKHTWRDEVSSIIKKYLGEERRAGRGLFKDKVSKTNETFEEQLLKQSDLFINLCRIEVEHKSTWIPDRVLGFLYSTSYARRDFFGEQLDDFENDIKTLFKQKGLTKWEETETHIALMAERK